jgi:hypothetical protein
VVLNLTELLRFSRKPTLWVGFLSLLTYAFSMSTLREQMELPRPLISPPPGIEYFSFGMKEQIGDTLWIRALQDIEYCEERIEKNNCKGDGWLWRMLDTATTLSPDFRIIYATGAIALSVIISDISGATKLFDKAVTHFPNDWPILYRAAYHAILEENDKAKGAKLLVACAQSGGPSWVSGLAGKLYAESGHIELAENLIRDLEIEQAPQMMIERIKRRIAEVKSGKK